MDDDNQYSDDVGNHETSFDEETDHVEWSDEGSTGSEDRGAGDHSDADFSAEADDPAASSADDAAPSASSWSPSPWSAPDDTSANSASLGPLLTESSDQSGSGDPGLQDETGSGLDPTSMATTSPLWVDPSTVAADPSASTVIGHPATDTQYFQYQGEGNAFCGPFSAAMAINAATGGHGPTGLELAQYAFDRGLIRQDGKNPAWGGWSGMTGDELDTLVDDYLADSGGHADRTSGNSLRDLESRLAANEKVIVSVDSGELRDANPDPDEGAGGLANHFLTVTGVDEVLGQVFLNDPLKQTPSVMPLTQFLGAWADSNNEMLDVISGGSDDVSTGAPAPLVDLAAAPPDSGSCCLLPMTLNLLAQHPVANIAEPPPPAQIVPLPGSYATVGGQSTLYDAAGHSLTGSPSAAPASSTTVGGAPYVPAASVQDDPTHVTLGYVPAQVPHPVEPANQSEYPTTPGGWQLAALRQQMAASEQERISLAAGFVRVDDD